MGFEASVIGLPRSRTFWFSRLLTMEGLHCYHDYHSYRYSKVKAGRVFNSSCAPWYPHTGKKVIIHRPRAEAEASFLAYTNRVPAEVVKQAFDLGERKLDRWEGLHVAYADINDRIVDILQYLDVKMSEERVQDFIGRNLQSSDNGEGPPPGKNTQYRAQSYGKRSIDL
jgi:hypothetical protein